MKEIHGVNEGDSWGREVIQEVNGGDSGVEWRRGGECSRFKL